MRLLFTALVTSTVLLLHGLDNPDLVRRGVTGIETWGHSVLQDKDIRIEGLRALSRTEVERVLPLDRSVFWWMANTPVVQARVADNPWIGDVSVERCGDGWFSEWGCFVVSVTERHPKYAAMVDNEAWIIADDGTFLIPVGGTGNVTVDLDRLVHITGLASRSASPDIVRAQLALAKNSIDALERTVSHPVRTLEFGQKGDLIIGFADLPFPIIFTSSPDSGISLEEQAVRCSRLLAELSGRFEDVEKIDLAFERVGIVKFKPSPKQPATRQ